VRGHPVLKTQLSTPKIQLGGEKISDDLNLDIDGTIIKRVRQAKFLGVTIDDQLNWKPNIDSLNKKLKSACG
jgi:hypothetical protein